MFDVSKNGNLLEVVTLITNGVNVNTRDDENTPLHCASYYGYRGHY